MTSKQHGPTYCSSGCKELVSSSCIDSKGPFSLTHRHFGAHNVLVNDEFEITLNLDAVLAAPLELAAQFPQLVGPDRHHPAMCSKLREYVQETLSKPKLLSIKMPLDKDMRLDTAEDYDNSLGRVILSEGAATVSGLESYLTHQDWIDNGWMGLYLECLIWKYGIYFQRYFS